MAFIGTGVEYALHCLLWITLPQDQRPSSRDLAELQGISPSFLSKIFQKLEKAGIVEATDGIAGGYRLGRPAERISVQDVIDAVEGQKALFDCQEIRARCALFDDGKAPRWATRGVCGIHAVMLRAEQLLRDELSKTSLASLSEGFVGGRLPPGFSEKVGDWFTSRQAERQEARVSALRASTRKRREEAQ